MVEEKWSSAYEDFFEAFKSYDEAGNSKKVWRREIETINEGRMGEVVGVGVKEGEKDKGKRREEREGARMRLNERETS